MTAFCRDCHDEAHDFRFFLDVGGSPEEYRKAGSETVATLLLRPEAVRRSLMRVGRAVRCEGRWAALVTGGARPRIGEVFRLFMRSRREWQDVVVTEVLDGRPGCWRVRKRFLVTGDDVRPMCVNTVCAEQPAPTAMSQAAAFWATPAGGLIPAGSRLIRRGTGPIMPVDRGGRPPAAPASPRPRSP